MRCFRSGRSPPPPAAATDDDRSHHQRQRPWPGREDHSPTSSSTPVSTAASSTSRSSTTINLTQEYAFAVQTNSYKEIWSKIFQYPAASSHRWQEHGNGSAAAEEEDAASSAHLIARVLHPDRASVQDALRAAPQTPISRLASRYFDTSELTSHFCLSLHRAVARAHDLYSPVTDLLDVLPHRLLSPAQCDWAFDHLLHFHTGLDNPFPAPTSLAAFRDMRLCFAELRQQLDVRLLQARRRHRNLRRATRASATCLVASTACLTIAAIALATHALAAIVAGPALLLGLPRPPTRDLLAGPRRRLREKIVRLDDAARGAYVLNNDLDTIEQLVARLHAVVESDRALVRLGLERGKGQRNLIEEVLRHLRSNYQSFLHQLRDLDEHVCLCFAAVNRARSLLLHHIYANAAHDAPSNQHCQEQRGSPQRHQYQQEADA